MTIRQATAVRRRKAITAQVKLVARTIIRGRLGIAVRQRATTERARQLVVVRRVLLGIAIQGATARRRITVQPAMDPRIQRRVIEMVNAINRHQRNLV